MRDQSVRYFIGSLFSRQVLYAYAIAGGFTTSGQLVMLWVGKMAQIPQRTEVLPVFIELYIETLLPLWIPPVTSWNILLFLINIVIVFWILLSWTISYDRSQRF